MKRTYLTPKHNNLVRIKPDVFTLLIDMQKFKLFNISYGFVVSVEEKTTTFAKDL